MYSLLLPEIQEGTLNDMNDGNPVILQRLEAQWKAWYLNFD
jgi:hypothetical protein